MTPWGVLQLSNLKQKGYIAQMPLQMHQSHVAPSRLAYLLLWKMLRHLESGLSLQASQLTGMAPEGRHIHEDKAMHDACRALHLASGKIQT